MRREMPLSKEDVGLPHDSFAICHQITTLDRSKLEARIGALPREAMERLEDGIGAACDLRI
jgi:mRNA-degrading endonuclease toxin of MazEF toxin-antitoxin module